VIIVLHLRTYAVCFCFITLDLAVETVDFDCSMMQLVHEGVSPFGHRVEFDRFNRWDVVRSTVVSTD
jgi:hypothetical protein